ncbi:LacI family transcriptional regulator [Actinoplanes sp. SE50]|uniref:LacI family transcriptional regulator n=1 Tax=unclassified Actinoplanes TaxID=2626549 RepID=UPI00023ECC2E|nr:MULTISPECIES: LacI family transcriptional regulator [unclassified Actinoplanes]AEV82090.1 LacI family transcription regulator [Actinoplanes sp. SE50/110]ATO80489.1 LacI family transcriptional regulator [Actinoplanes sp. SE50]SLL97896.1 hypothetical protein ACSP50_1109 [Actinoplanes sp. SE50/110]
MRTVATPPFLNGLLQRHLASGVPLKCPCVPRVEDDSRIPWCTGGEYAFATAESAHYRRSNVSERIFRPAADGWYPQRAPRRPRMPRMPVLVDHQFPWPGKPLPAWPAVAPGEPYELSQGRGRPRVTDESRLASWLPVLCDLTPHGMRHGYQTWMDEDEIPYVAQSQQMGHEVPGMHGIYSHVTDRMLERIRAALQLRWEESLRARAALPLTSAVPLLAAALKTLPREASAPNPLPNSDA